MQQRHVSIAPASVQWSKINMKTKLRIIWSIFELAIANVLVRGCVGRVPWQKVTRIGVDQDRRFVITRDLDIEAARDQHIANQVFVAVPADGQVFDQVALLETRIAADVKKESPFGTVSNLAPTAGRAA